MEQPLLAGHKLDKDAIGHHALDGTLVGLTHLGYDNDAIDHLEGTSDRLLIGRSDLDHADTALGVLLDIDLSTGLLLHALDDLTAGADDRADELLRHLHLLHAGRLRLQLRTRTGDGALDDVKDMEAGTTCLLKSLCQHLVAQSVDLDIHLSGGDTLTGTGHLEVHISHVVLITEDVGEDRLLISLAHHTHGNAGDGTDHRHTGILQRQRTGADRSHGGGSVALQDVAHHADGVGVVLGDHAVEGTHGEVAVTDLSAADALGARGLSGAEGREIVVEEEALLALEESIVDQLLIVLGTEGDRSECLGLSAGEDS